MSDTCNINFDLTGLEEEESEFSYTQSGVTVTFKDAVGFTGGSFSGFGRDLDGLNILGYQSPF